MKKPTQKLIDASSPLFQEVIGFHQAGQLDAAEGAYQALLETYPEDHRILSNLGTLYLQQGDLQKGIATIESSLALHGDQPHAHNSLGNAMAALGDFENALPHFERALQLHPEMVDAAASQANALHHLGRLDEALQAVGRALSNSADRPELHLLKGTILLSITALEEALFSINAALTLNPHWVEAYIERGRTYFLMEREAEALQSYDHAISLNQNAAAAYLGGGLVLQKLDRLEEAQLSLEEAIRLNPQDYKTLNQYGIVLHGLGHFEAALSASHRAIEVNPKSYEAFTNRGNVFFELRRYEEALEDYRVALELMPSQAQIYFNRGAVYGALKEDHLALSDYRAAYRLDPLINECLSPMVFHAHKVMDWVGLYEILHDIRSQLDKDVNIGPPFPFLAALDDPKIHLKLASKYLETKLKGKKNIPDPFFSIPSGKIKIGYFSSDFREHPVAINLWPLIKSHDRDRFEVIAFNFSPRGSFENAHPILRAFDHVYDILEVSDLDAANLARKLGLDIAIDLNGQTEHARTGIFRFGAAPIQVNFLGYPGTMGAKDYDYIIADQVVIPEAHRDQYVERAVHLPHFFMPYAFHERQESPEVNRAQFGLPENRFVFCSFNDFYKISEAIFEAWITLLASTKESVLFIAIRGGLEPEAFLRKFESQGIEPHRIIVAQRTAGHEEHLARLALCDLMLDTFPYNSHTTACDAISIGLPLLTMCGQSFASRVSSSLLQHVGVPELIAQNLDEYCQKAIQMAEDAVHYQGLRDRLVKGRSHLPSTLTYARNLESLYGLMVDDKLKAIREKP